MATINKVTERKMNVRVGLEIFRMEAERSAGSCFRFRAKSSSEKSIPCLLGVRV